MIIDISTHEYPCTESTIRAAHPNVSLSSSPDDETLAMLGYARVQPTEPPEGDVVTEGPPELVEGEWRQTWEVREFTPEEIEANRKALVPEKVGPFEARAALHLAGLLEDVEALVAHPDTDPLTKLAWEKASEFRRDSVMIATMTAVLGWTEEQVDELFIAAGQVVA